MLISIGKFVAKFTPMAAEAVGQVGYQQYEKPYKSTGNKNRDLAIDISLGVVSCLPIVGDIYDMTMFTIDMFEKEKGSYDQDGNWYREGEEIPSSWYHYWTLDGEPMTYNPFTMEKIDWRTETFQHRSRVACYTVTDPDEIKKNKEEDPFWCDEVSREKALRLEQLLNFIERRKRK